MYYIPEEAKVVYRSKDGKEEKIFDALEWLAAMCCHVPNKGEQMVRYAGFYSNVSRGKRKKQDQDGVIPSILEPDGSSREYRKNWARLIQKIYEVDPLTCPRCSGTMKVISVIEDEQIIRKILKQLGLWEIKPRPPPKSAGPQKTSEYSIDYSVSQLPACDAWLYVDPSVSRGRHYLILKERGLTRGPVYSFSTVFGRANVIRLLCVQPTPGLNPPY